MIRSSSRRDRLRPGAKEVWRATETPIEAFQPVYDALWAARGRYRGPGAEAARQEAENGAEAELRARGPAAATQKGSR
jgi:hypothetical protein